MSTDHRILDFDVSICANPNIITNRVFASLHKSALNSIFKIDFPSMPAKLDIKAYCPLGGVLRAFLTTDHAKRVIGSLKDEDVIVTEREDLYDAEPTGYVVVSGHRHRKSAEQAAARLAAHLQKNGVDITYPISIGSPAFVHKNGPYILYTSSSGKNMRITIERTFSDICTGSFSSFGLSKGGATVPVYSGD